MFAFITYVYNTRARNTYVVVTLLREANAKNTAPRDLIIFVSSNTRARPFRADRKKRKTVASPRNVPSVVRKHRKRFDDKHWKPYPMAVLRSSLFFFGPRPRRLSLTYYTCFWAG